MLHRVVPLAQVGEVRCFRRAAECRVVGVVDFAADRRGAASGESAVLVSGLQVSAHRRRDPVRIHGEHGAGDRVGDEPLPRGRRPGEQPCGGRVDGGAPDEVARLVRTRQGEGGDDDLDACADRADPRATDAPGVARSGLRPASPRRVRRRSIGGSCRAPAPGPATRPTGSPRADPPRRAPGSHGSAPPRPAARRIRPRAPTPRETRGTRPIRESPPCWSYPHSGEGLRHSDPLSRRLNPRPDVKIFLSDRPSVGGLL